MDLDAYSAAHRDEWDELARLGAKRSFSGSESDRLIERYQSGASQLSAIKTTAGQSVQGDRLSLSLSRARLRFTGAGSNVLSQLPAFFGAQLPAALYRIRWTSLVVALSETFRPSNDGNPRATVKRSGQATTTTPKPLITSS